MMAFVNKSTQLLHSKPIASCGSTRAKSLWSVLAGRVRLFIHGTEDPIPKWKPTIPDTVLEEVYKTHPHVVPYERRQYFKEAYMQRKSHDILIEHNKRIRALDKKIKAGVYDNYDYANKW